MFFHAEDGIRDRNVTGVQTCALPICVDSLRPVENIYLSTFCGNPGCGTGTIPLACRRGLDDAPSRAQRATDAPQGDSSTGKFAQDPLPDTTTSSPPSILIVAGQARDLPIRGAPVVRRPD